MPRLRIAFSLLVALLLLLGFAPSAVGAAIFTLQLASGETLEDVTGEIDQQYMVVKLDSGRTVSFAEITAIRMGGVDVTREILGRSAPEAAPEASEPPKPPETPEAPETSETPETAPPEAGSEPAVPPEPAPEAAPRPEEKPPWVSKYSEAYREIHQPLWRWGIKAGANYSTPTGNYYDGFTSGPGYDFEVWAALTHNAALRAGVSRSGAKLDNDLYLISLDPGVSILSQDLGARVMRYYVAAQAYRHLDRASGRLSMWYLYAGLGAVNTRLSVKARFSDGTSIDTSTGETKFLMNYGAGVVIAATRHLGVDLGGHVDQVFVESNNNATSFAWILDLKAGLVALF